ncbi:MAG: DUF971 domain-containing protein [Acidobacteria bacterium]|jgi:DUF971 family protein|nr:DUF971 domain-containing protein [Acidobacteriota bacterium]
MSTSDPASVDISKSKGVTIVWSNGHRSEYALQYLRDHCPCAICTTKAGAPPPPGPANPLPLYKPPLRILDVESTGRYGIRFYWNDGHSTGIFSFDHLRELCPCPECSLPTEPRA